jgi:hypothetical protein
VSLSSASSAVSVPANVNVPQGASAASFAISTSNVSVPTSTTISATYAGTTKTTTFTVNPPVVPAALSGITLTSTSVIGGGSTTGKVTLTKVAPTGGITVALRSSNTAYVTVPETVFVPAGATTSTFPVATSATKRNVSATISATYAGVTKTASLTVKRR